MTHGFTFYWQTQRHIYLSWRQKQFKDLLMFWDGGETFPCSLILSQQERRKLHYKDELSIFDTSGGDEECKGEVFMNDWSREGCPLLITAKYRGILKHARYRVVKLGSFFRECWLGYVELQAELGLVFSRLCLPLCLRIGQLFARLELLPVRISSECGEREWRTGLDQSFSYTDQYRINVSRLETSQRWLQRSK